MVVWEGCMVPGGVHGPEGGGVWSRGCMVPGEGCMVPGVFAWSWGVCMVGGDVWSKGVHGPRGVHGLGMCMVGGVPDGDPLDGLCCGRYASYWNAFLFSLICIVAE